MKNRSILSALLALAIASTLAGTAWAQPTVDGTINSGEYANQQAVMNTPDLGGVYDPGTTGSFAGGSTNCHDDWTLYWDFDATHIYFAADGLGAGSSCADQAISVHLFAGPDPVGSPAACTGGFWDLNAHNFHFGFECSGGTFSGVNTGQVFQSSPPSSTETFANGTLGSTLPQLEWSNVRSDLNAFGDTTYTGDLACVWFRASAYDSRSVDNGTGPGARTIYLKLNPALSCNPEFETVGECISTLISENCSDVTGRARADCNHEQQNLCLDLFDIP